MSGVCDVNVCSVCGGWYGVCVLFVVFGVVLGGVWCVWCLMCAGVVFCVCCVLCLWYLVLCVMCGIWPVL